MSKTRISPHMPALLLLSICGVAVLAAGVVLRAQNVPQGQQMRPEVALKAARDKEVMDGDLKGAIEDYKRVFEMAAANRPVAAQALLGMAALYERLGQPEARPTYERIARDYFDQPGAAASARMKLAGGSQASPSTGDRVVWSRQVYPFGRVSPDGRFIVGRGGNGGLMVRDIQADARRDLTPAPAEYYAEWTRHATFSPDGKRVAYEWHDAKNGYRLEFRIATVPATGHVAPKTVFVGSEDIYTLHGFDWSADGKWIAAALLLKDRTGQLAVIEVDTGRLKVLRSLDWDVPEEVFFSRDGRYIAYDKRADLNSTQHDVFVMESDGARLIHAVDHSANDFVIGWSPDGTRLLFSSDRRGVTDMYSLPFSSGAVKGQPELIKPDIGMSFEGRTRSLGVTSSGSVFVHKRVSTRDVTIAAFDIEAGKLLSAPQRFAQGPVSGARNPVWSPDGRSLAYPVKDGTGISIRSVETGQVRQLPLTLSYARALLDWSHDGRSLMVAGTDLKGRNGVFRFDIQTGDVTPVTLNAGNEFNSFAQWSPDGQKVYYHRQGGFFELTLATGSERELLRDGGNIGTSSPDGRYLTALRGINEKTATLLIVPVSGGPPRELLKLTQPETFMGRRMGREAWTPDGNGVLVTKNTGKNWELWLVPVTGAAPRKLEIDANIFARDGMVEDTGVSLSPDGRTLAFVTGETRDQVWALETFLTGR